MKLVTDLGENEVIHCPTIEEADAICRLMDGAGYSWAYSDETFLTQNKYDRYGEETCYRPLIGTFGSFAFYTKVSYTIHKASEFLTELPAKTVLTKQQIADKFGVEVENLEIEL